MEKYRIVVVCKSCGKTEELIRRTPISIEQLLPGWVTLYEIEGTPDPLKIIGPVKLPIFYCPDCIKNI